MNLLPHKISPMVVVVVVIYTDVLGPKVHRTAIINTLTCFLPAQKFDSVEIFGYNTNLT